MAHQRKLIRQAVTALLIGATAAGARVFPSRVLPLRTPELPTIAVYTADESVEEGSRQSAPRELERLVSVVVEAWVAPADDVDDAMDDIAEQIEVALHADPYWGGVVGDSILTGSETEVVGQGDRRMGLVILTYAAIYHTLAPEPPDDGDMDNLVQVDTTFDHNGDTHEDDRLEDEIVVHEDYA